MPTVLASPDLEPRLFARAAAHITQPCLIAADVDKTILAQMKDPEKEEDEFRQRIAPALVEAARLGANLAFVTGNSMFEMCSRLMKFLINELCYRKHLELIDRFHFFCNSGGVYFHIPASVVEETRGVSSADLCSHVLEMITESRDGEVIVRPQFVDQAYIGRCSIPEEDVRRILKLVNDAASEYQQQVSKHLPVIAKKYKLRDFECPAGITPPTATARATNYLLASGVNASATVQITLKPVLSYKHATYPWAKKLIGNDLRQSLVEKIQLRLEQEGLGRYTASSGGRSSIDITLGRLNKQYALDFLIDLLKIEGRERLAQPRGSNAIYIGDEVMAAGGNDYSVTRIPGLFVFAVNENRSVVPFLRDVLFPGEGGPEATTNIIEQWNDCARRLLRKYRDGFPTKTATEALVEEVCWSRIDEKLHQLHELGITMDDLKFLQSILTLMARRESARARRILTLLKKEMDTVLAEDATAYNDGVNPPASGTSHPDF